MFIDALLRVSSAQAFAAVGVSTNSIDLGNVTPKRSIGTGEPMGFGISIDVLLVGATLLVEVISATDAALTAGIVVEASRLFTTAQAPAGAVLFVDLPMGTPTNRFLGLRITPTTSVTLTATLTARNLWSIASANYAKNYVV